VVNHQFGHASIHKYLLAGDKSGFFAAQKQREIRAADEYSVFGF
jgi:hypothetical protein